MSLKFKIMKSTRLPASSSSMQILTLKSSVFAMGVIAASNSIGVQLSVSYCIDSYKDLSGEAMVTVVIIRNTMSFAIGYGVTHWVTNMGYQNAFILAAFAGLAQVSTFLAVVKWGKSWRSMTKQRYYRFVKESQSLGVSY